MCGFDGALGHYRVAIEAAHVRWRSQQDPDEMANALALCALHHALFDLGALDITGDRRICVSRLYVARSEVGRAVDALADKLLLIPRPQTASSSRYHLHHMALSAGLQRSRAPVRLSMFARLVISESDKRFPGKQCRYIAKSVGYVCCPFRQVCQGPNNLGCCQRSCWVHDIVSKGLDLLQEARKRLVP
jgi:hypothetical protein